MSSKRISVGDLVEVKWLDACFYSHLSEVDATSVKQGGNVRYTVGFLIARTKTALMVCAELDESRKPDRDVNLIPRGMVLKVTRAK